MKTILKLIVTAIAVLLLANLLPGIYVDSFWTSLVVAVALSLLRLIVKPILILFTLPITVLTLGLFLFLINAILISMAGYLVTGFGVENLWYALIFSVLLTLVQSLLFGLIKEEK